MKRRVFASLTCFALVASMTVAQAQEAETSDPSHYLLTWDKLEKAAAATDAIKALMKADPELKKRIDKDLRWEPPDDAQASKIDSHFPQVAAAIHRNGLTTRDYMLTRIAVLIDSFVFKSEEEKGATDDTSDAIPAQNRALLKKHASQLQELGEHLFFDKEK